MKINLKRGLVVGAAASMMMSFALMRVAHGSDHADTPDNAANPGQDISDVYVFPSPTHPDNVVLAMDVSPLITPMQVGTRRFDRSVLYQFKIDNTGDNVEDLVIQAWFKGTDKDQVCYIAGPAKPKETGVMSESLKSDRNSGTFNKTFMLSNGSKVFCGTREDPFFFDLEQFFNILPDRAYPVTHNMVPDPDVPKATTFRNPGIDFLSNGNYNVLSIVCEVPKSLLKGSNGDKINVWCTTSKAK